MRPDIAWTARLYLHELKQQWQIIGQVRRELQPPERRTCATPSGSAEGALRARDCRFELNHIIHSLRSAGKLNRFHLNRSGSRRVQHCPTIFGQPLLLSGCRRRASSPRDVASDHQQANGLPVQDARLCDEPHAAGW